MAEVKIQLKPVDGESHPKETERLSDFIKAGVELAMERVSKETMAFDGRTGEPLYTAPYPDLEAARLISAMHVFSPTAMTELLQTNFSNQDNHDSTSYPILMATPDDDDD